MLDLLIYVLAGLLTVSVPVFYILHYRRKSRKASIILQKAIERGLDEPVSLHPFIDPNICIGSGSCVTACPENDVLGLVNNRGTLINPSRCIGHGMCQAACPVDAISLVFGTDKRGVDIPHLKGTFESNVPGIYIAGELGGMGLIRNAVTQGSEAVQYIAESLDGHVGGEEMYDLAIVGAGPAGIAASLQAKKLGLHFVTLDQEDLGGTVLTYPRRKLVMTHPMELPLYGAITTRQIEKESLLDIFIDVFKQTGLSVQSGEKVETIEGESGRFHVVTRKNEYNAKRILLAIGRRGSPRKLGVPGEKSGMVAYRLLDPEKFHDVRLLVVGGGDSAIEAAVALAEQPGNTVHISYRRESFFRIKEGNRERIERLIANGEITPLFSSNVQRIEEGQVHLEQNGETVTLPVDQVFVFAGGELPTQFLERVGITFERKFGEA